MAKGHRTQNHGMAPPADSREALQWFVNNYLLYVGSTRGLFLSDWNEEQAVSLEAAVISLKSRGFAPFTIAGETLYEQADFIFNDTRENFKFGRPPASKVELELTGNDIVIVDGLEAPEKAHHLWYLWSYFLFPRAIAGKVTIITTPLSYQEFIRYGHACPDFDFLGRPINWEKLVWLIEACTINQELFKLAREESLPPMLKTEYYLYTALKDRGLEVMPQHVLSDYMLDFALIKGEQRLNIECDILSPLSGHEIHTKEAKRDFVLLSDGWQVLKFSNSEILNNRGACADVVEDIWKAGRKRSHCGRLLSGKSLPQSPQLPEDDAQRNAIVFGGGPVALVGGAGTGKTACLAQRCAYLISQGISPETILMLSFSAESARLLKQAIVPRVEKSVAQRLNVMSWHELGMKILRENLPAIKRKPPIKLETSPQKVLQKILVKTKKEVDSVKLEMAGDLDEFYLAAMIGMYKAHLISPKKAREDAQGDADEIIARIYQAYEDQLQKANRIDKHDVSSLAAQVLLDNPEVRVKYQSNYEFVLVDEYQDVTVAQDMLGRLLAAPQDNFFITGDEDETISENRNACPDLLSDFSFRFPNGRCMVLEHNWRCHPLIVDYARLLLSHLERSRISKEFVSAWGQSPSQAVFGPQVCADELEESRWIAAQVKALLDAGRNPGEIAILYRHSEYESMIEQELAAVGVRFHASQSDNSMIPDEVGDMIAFLKLVMDPDGPKARDSFERVCQLGTKEIDPKLSATIASFAGANNLSYLKAVEIYAEATADQSCRELEQLVRIIRAMNQDRLPPAESIGYLRRTRRLNDYYKSIKVPPGQVYEPGKKLSKLEEEARKVSSVAEFIKLAEERQGEEEQSDEDQSVHIKSIFDVKGHEFGIVFLCGLAHGLFPQENSEDIEEERRQFYVAFTRAKEAIFLSYPCSFAGKERLPSLFLSETHLVAQQVYAETIQQAAAMEAPPFNQEQIAYVETSQSHSNPPYAEPAYTQAAYVEPNYAEPSYAERAYAEPAYEPVPAATSIPLPTQPYSDFDEDAQAAQVAKQLTQQLDVSAYDVEEIRGGLSPFVSQPEIAPARGMNYRPPSKGGVPDNVKAAPASHENPEPVAPKPLLPPAPPSPPLEPRPPVAPVTPERPKTPVVSASTNPVQTNYPVQNPAAASLPLPPQPPTAPIPPTPPNRPSQLPANPRIAEPPAAVSAEPAQSQDHGTYQSAKAASLGRSELPGESPGPQGHPPGHEYRSNVDANVLHNLDAQGPYLAPSMQEQLSHGTAHGTTPGYSICPSCQNPLEPNARFCGECGYSLPSAPPAAAEEQLSYVIVCMACGSQLESGAKFCGECGTPFQTPADLSDPATGKAGEKTGWMVKFLKFLED